MDRLPDTHSIDRLEPVIQAFATAGRQRWRSILTDVSELERLSAVQAELEYMDGVTRDANAVRDAIESAVERAIQRIADPFSDAARAHFGYGNDEKLQGERFALAAPHLGFKSARWYDGERSESPYFGIKPRDYIIRLVTYALAGAEDPIACVDAERRRGGGASAPETSAQSFVDDEHAARSTTSDAGDHGSAQRPRRRRWPRRSLGWMVAGAGVASAIVVVAAVLATISGPNRSPSKAKRNVTGQPIASQAAMTSSPTYQLAAGLRGVNRSYEKHWDTRIRADVTDRLRFALTLANRAAKQSPELLAWVHLDGDPGIPHGRRVGVVLARPDGSILLRSPSLHIRGWSQDNSPFVFGPDTASISDVSGRVIRKVALSGAPGTAPRELRALPPGLGPWAIRIGRLTPHQQVVVQVDAMWNSFPPGPEGFGGATPLFRVDTTPKQEWRSSGGVHVGDQVEILLLLDNQSFQERFAHVRVGVQPRRHGQFLRLTLFGTLQGTPEQKIGSATINSSDGRPISLIPQPSSTKLIVPRPGPKGRSDPCYKGGHDSSLDDGITLGGIDIGFFGGYTLHAGCGGTEFNRQIRLRATVIAR